MALDTKQKRGSVLGLSLPWRTWQVEPSGTLGVGNRQSLLKLGSAIVTGALVHVTTGVLTGPGSSVVGTAAHIAVHGTTGVLTGAGSAIVGTAAHIATHPTSGVLTGAGAAIVGAAARSGSGGTTHITTGVLTGPGGQIVGYVSNGLIVAISSRGRMVLDVKVLADTKRITFDFISQMVGGEFLVSAVNTISVYSGSDPGGLLTLVGSAAVTGTRTTQFITGGAAGCMYQIICRGLTNLNRKTYLNSFLLVL